jgi:hypothetical protein
MKLFATATALALLLAWPTVGEAQSSNGAKARSTTQQKQQQQQAARRAQASARRPCAADGHYVGCLGWDPDGSIRLMMALDRGMYDD